MFHINVANTLLSKGYDMERVSVRGLSRADDSKILEQAIAEKRILITMDDDFGDWVVLPLKEHYGVIRIKTNPSTSKYVLSILLPFLEKHSNDTFNNNLIILSKNRARWIKTF
ncbi:hypothetical protein BVX93_02140 [bacterium B13(2017)]|nr:hypothetical protein BVX93_02140 [bacterium B13(2017)]